MIIIYQKEMLKENQGEINNGITSSRGAEEERRRYEKGK